MRGLQVGGAKTKSMRDLLGGWEMGRWEVLDIAGDGVRADLWLQACGFTARAWVEPWCCAVKGKEEQKGSWRSLCCPLEFPLAL